MSTAVTRNVTGAGVQEDFLMEITLQVASCCHSKIPSPKLQLGKERVYLSYSSRSQSINEGNRQAPWRKAAYWLAFQLPPSLMHQLACFLLRFSSMCMSVNICIYVNVAYVCSVHRGQKRT